MARTPRKKGVKKPKKGACSFCDRPDEAGGPTILHRNRHKKVGPWICEICVNQAASIISEEIDETRCAVYVSTSRIHGRGVFAGQRIFEGTYVGTYEGWDDCSFSWANEQFVIYNYETKEDEDSDEATSWRLGTNEFRFLNHSDDANLEMDENYHFWALRTIKKDEELTWYYGEAFDKDTKKKSKKKR